MIAATSYAVRKARLCANRSDGIRFAKSQMGSVQSAAEIGVAYGDFSIDLIHQLKPKNFFAVDLFGFHEEPIIWGEDPQNRLKGATHEQYYTSRLRPLAQPETRLQVRQGLSWEEIPRLGKVDLIYLDAGHSREEVARDVAAIEKIAHPNLWVVFNDYVLRDFNTCAEYGVVPVVNGLLASGEWECMYLALDPYMHCDIALRPSTQDA